MAEGIAGLLQGLQNIMTSPSFSAGASIYQGADPGQAMARAQQMQMQAQQAEALKQQRIQQDEMKAKWAEMVQSGQVPQSIAPLAQFMDPQQGASMIARHNMGEPERQRQAQMDQMRINLMRKQAEAKAGSRYMKSGNQIVEIGPDGKPRVVHQAPMSPIDEAKMKFFQGLMPEQGQQPGQPQLMPQSYEGGTNAGQDPRLVPTQARGQHPGATMPQMTPEQKQAFGLNMIVPGAGNMLLKSNEAQAKREGWQTPTKNKIDENIFNTVEQSARLAEVEKQFKPEYLTLAGGAKALGAKWWEKAMGEGSLDPKTQTYLKEFSAFKQGAIANLNSYIKEVTGAQMSEAEAKRLRQGMPDAGDDMVSGDSPSEFISKLKDKHRMMRLAMARYSYLRSGRWKGGVFNGDMSKGAPISLDQMRSIMRQRRNELMTEAKLRAPTDPDQQRSYMIQRMQQEFGV